MDKQTTEKKHPTEAELMWVVTSVPMMSRGGSEARQLKIEELSVNVNVFIQQMGKVLEKTPEKVEPFSSTSVKCMPRLPPKVLWRFQAQECRQWVVVASSGLHFVFRRASAS